MMSQVVLDGPGRKFFYLLIIPVVPVELRPCFARCLRVDLSGPSLAFLAASYSFNNFFSASLDRVKSSIQCFSLVSFQVLYGQYGTNLNVPVGRSGFFLGLCCPARGWLFFPASPVLLIILRIDVGVFVSVLSVSLTFCVFDGPVSTSSNVSETMTECPKNILKYFPRWWRDKQRSD